MAAKRVANVNPDLRRMLVPIDTLKGLEDNARRGDVERIRESLRRFGQYVPIVVREQTAEVLKGNHTLQAAIAEGWTHVAASWRDEPDDNVARDLALADNRIGDLADWDIELLAADLKRAQASAAGLAGVAYTEADLQDVLAQAALAAAKEAGAALGALADPGIPDTPRRPVTRPGDVVRMGDHVLVCGDSGDPATVAKAKQAAGVDALDLVFTSPPYNVGVGYYGEHADDELDGDAYLAFLKRIAGEWAGALAPGRAFCWNIGTAPDTKPAHQHLMLEDLGLSYFRQIVWDKKLPGVPLWHHVEKDPVARNIPVEYCHELVLIFTTGPLERGARLPALDQDARTSVVHLSAINSRKDLPDGGGHHAGGAIGRKPGTPVAHAAGHAAASPKSNLDRDKARRRRGAAGSVGAGLNRNYDKPHPAVFPVQLPRPWIVHLTAPGETVADPFGGAGTVAIVAEQLDRRAIIVEIDTGFCDVAIERWEKLTGQQAERPRRRRAARTKETAS